MLSPFSFGPQSRWRAWYNRSLGQLWPQYRRMTRIKGFVSATDARRARKKLKRQHSGSLSFVIGRHCSRYMEAGSNLLLEIPFQPRSLAQYLSASTFPESEGLPPPPPSGTCHIYTDVSGRGNIAGHLGHPGEATRAFVHPSWMSDRSGLGIDSHGLELYAAVHSVRALYQNGWNGCHIHFYGDNHSAINTINARAPRGETHGDCQLLVNQLVSYAERYGFTFEASLVGRERISLAHHLSRRNWTPAAAIDYNATISAMESLWNPNQETRKALKTLKQLHHIRRERMSTTS